MEMRMEMVQEPADRIIDVPDNLHDVEAGLYDLEQFADLLCIHAASREAVEFLAQCICDSLQED